MNRKTPQIFGYLDYRVFLHDFYQHKKFSENGFSYRAFAKALGFTSPNYLKLVIDGERSISPEATVKFIKAFQFTDRQAHYFQNLVKLTHSKNPADKENYLSQLHALIPKPYERILTDNEIEYSTHWLLPAIREMATMKNFSTDIYGISKKLQWEVSLQELQKAVNVLVKQGFITRDHDGIYRPQEKSLSSTDELPNPSIRTYHRMILKLAAVALDQVPLDQREFNALTFSLPKKSLPALKERIKEFVDEIHDWSLTECEKHQADRVLQLNLQMFPHSKH